MRTVITVLFVFLFLTADVAAQGTIPELTQNDIPGGQRTRSEYFNGSALYGLIDGGADLYLEYGFTKVLVQEICWRGYPFRIELYQMQSTEAAFGIFSISRHDQLHMDSLTRYCSQTPHQIRIALGVFYISIANDGGTPEEQSFSKQLAHKYLAKINTNGFQLPKFFTGSVYRPYINGLKYVRGKLGIQNGFPEWENLFDGIAFSSLYILPVPIQNENMTIAQIDFISNKDKMNFFKISGVSPLRGKKYSETTIDSTVKAIKDISSTKIIYLESRIKSKDITPFLHHIKAFN
jgi:hypothetical protein